MRLILNTIGYGLSIIGKLKDTRVKNNLYYEIKDKIVEEAISNGKMVRTNKITKVYGLHSTTDVRNGLIELLRERMNLHKDKFISPTIYQELRGLEVKRNGKVEHSDLTHDDQIFSYLMALYVWYNGKNLRETFGIEKCAIQTEESVDDIVELEGANGSDQASMLSAMESVNRVDNSELNKLAKTIQEMKQAQGVMFSEFAKKQQEHDQQLLKAFLMNPVNRKAYADKYNIPVDSVSFEDGTNYDDPRSSMGIPDSFFNDFYKNDEELGSDSIYNNIGGDNHMNNNYEDNGLQ